MKLFKTNKEDPYTKLAKLIQEGMQEYKLIDKELKFINGTGELVYGVDIETHRIIYVNEALKKLLGKDTIGELCYNALQNVNHPCNTCTIDQTPKQLGKPIKWVYKNNITKKWYFLIDVAKKIKGRLIQIEKAYEIPNDLATKLNLK